MDLFLALSEDAIHRVLWTDDLLDEWERVIVREHHRTNETAASVTSAIREFFADCRIERELYAHLVATMPGDDPADRPHIAAAVAVRVDALVTANLRDFPEAPIGSLGVRVVAPDAYLVELVEEFPSEVIGTVVRLAGEKTRPRRSVSDLIDLYRGAGLTDFSERLGSLA